MERAAPVVGQALPSCPGPEQASGTGRLVVSDTEPKTFALPKSPTLRILSDVDELILEKSTTPDWAKACGRDKYGLWAEFELKDVRQRMRWIPPGRFLMGSPTTEQVRYEEEGPHHEVTLTHGYWLFDTPCTQALWLAVMGGKNPSFFPDPKRPVEQVTFVEVEQFLLKANKAVKGLVFGLPSEAQWEYACRAGTTTATYAGDLEIFGENNAPILDLIAWYGGNSGRNYDLKKKSVGTSDWKEKHYPDTRAGTRQLGLKRPNGWGLFDMLGNVWEWCRDGQRAYSDQGAVDPVGPLEAGSLRVIRGGSWDDDARTVRAAQRDWHSRDNRNLSLGFRCLSYGRC